eukprot:TRINITY_DN17711_c0_g1_i14.p3 TRINITY_DN17711_c0_g1~~TRINITY_DN17711_c0_g1_i14.p3  ORF type:complete len:160 (+),score=4.23 TRINITY_DN17711_c0_g1_i14:467-946(+)
MVCRVAKLKFCVKNMTSKQITRILTGSDYGFTLLAKLPYKYFGLNCCRTSSTTTIDNVNFHNCFSGLAISDCTNNVSIEKVYVEKCSCRGCYFDNAREISLKDVEIVSCPTGIECYSITVGLQNCSFVGVQKEGIYLHRSSMRYQEKIVSVNSSIMEIL